MDAFDERLVNDYDEARCYSERPGSVFRIEPDPRAGNRPARRWLVRYLAPTLVRDDDNSEPRVVDRFDVHFQYPPTYLSRLERASDVVTLVHPRQAFHPNVAGPRICLSIHQGQPLLELIDSVYLLLTYQTAVPENPYNPIAADWYLRHLTRFPLSTVPLGGATPWDFAAGCLVPQGDAA